MHKNCAYYAGIMLNAFAYYYALNYAGIIGAGLHNTSPPHQLHIYHW